MNFGRLCCINVGSLTITNVLLWWGMLRVGEAMNMVSGRKEGKGYIGNLCVFWSIFLWTYNRSKKNSLLLIFYIRNPRWHIDNSMTRCHIKTCQPPRHPTQTSLQTELTTQATAPWGSTTLFPGRPQPTTEHRPSHFHPTWGFLMRNLCTGTPYWAGHYFLRAAGWALPPPLLFQVSDLHWSLRHAVPPPAPLPSSSQALHQINLWHSSSITVPASHGLKLQQHTMKISGQ